MPVAPLNLIKRYDEFRPKDERGFIPKNSRGIYVLLKKKGPAYKVIYIGLAGGEKSGIHGRLNSHARTKKDAWSHFSLFEVHDNVSKEVIQELEGLFRHIYWKDDRALQFCLQKKFKKLGQVQKTLADWKTGAN